MGYFSRKRGLAEIQGRLQEDAAVRKIGGDVGNINDLTVENFRTYDLISSEGVFSVKSHLSSNGELTDWAKSAYQANFDSLLGWGREVDAVERDAKAFFDKIPSGTPSPKEIAQANLQQATEFLKNKSVLCIPEDHVQGMREHLRDQAGSKAVYAGCGFAFARRPVGGAASCEGKISPVSDSMTVE